MVLPKLAWGEIEPSTVKVDGRFEVILVPEAIGHLLDRLDFGVEPLAHCIGHLLEADRVLLKGVGDEHEPFLEPDRPGGRSLRRALRL